MKLLTDIKSKSTIAQRIDLYFRDTEHAQIADLQIKFKRTGDFSTKQFTTKKFKVVIVILKHDMKKNFCKSLKVGVSVLRCKIKGVNF